MQHKFWGKSIVVFLLSLCLMSCAVIQGKSTPTEYTSDAAITTQIKSKFVGSDMLSAGAVNVTTQNGVVQLSGFVSNNAQIAEAVKLAQEVKGVRRVVNSIVVDKSRHYHHYHR